MQSMVQIPLLFISVTINLQEASRLHKLFVGAFQESNFCRYKYLDVTRFSAAAMFAYNTTYTNCVRAFSSR